jgi:hypothetical protein
LVCALDFSSVWVFNRFFAFIIASTARVFRAANLRSVKIPDDPEIHHTPPNLPNTCPLCITGAQTVRDPANASRANVSRPSRSRVDHARLMTEIELIAAARLPDYYSRRLVDSSITSRAGRHGFQRIIRGHGASRDSAIRRPHSVRRRRHA